MKHLLGRQVLTGLKKERKPVWSAAIRALPSCEHKLKIGQIRLMKRKIKASMNCNHGKPETLLECESPRLEHFDFCAALAALLKTIQSSVLPHVVPYDPSSIGMSTGFGIDGPLPII